MIKINNILKILIVGVCMIFYGVPAAFSDNTGSGGNSGSEPSESDYNYSNLYPKDKGLPILPQAMVMYCKFDAEKAVQDWSIITECFKKYAKAMNSSNVATKTEGMKDYDTMRLQALNHTLAQATAIGTSVPNFEKVQNKNDNAGSSTNNEAVTTNAITSAHTFTTKMINNVRKLYAEYLQYLAIDAIGNIDPTALLSDEEIEESKNSAEDNAGTGSQ